MVLREQTDTLTSHFAYVNRASAGTGIIVIEEVKLGRQISTLQLTLWQGDGILSHAPWVTPSVTRRVMHVSATQVNLRKFSGHSFPTNYELATNSSIAKPPDFTLLQTTGGDPSWKECEAPASTAKLRPSLLNWRYFLPAEEPIVPGYTDLWMSLASGESITQAAMPYVVDAFPYEVVALFLAPEVRAALEPAPTSSRKAEQGKAMHNGKLTRGDLWFPTVVLNLENKTLLPSEGVKWLNMRVAAKQIKDGRMDINVTIRDTNGQIIALSHQVALMVSMDRNLGKKPSL